MHECHYSSPSGEVSQKPTTNLHMLTSLCVPRKLRRTVAATRVLILGGSYLVRGCFAVEARHTTLRKQSLNPGGFRACRSVRKFNE